MLQLRNLKLNDAPQQKKLNTKQTIAWLRSAGAISDNPWQLGDCEKIKNKWYGQPCYVVGTGPTLKPFLEKFGWDYFEGKHAIGINHAIEDYDKFEWFFFLDKRFLDKTTYDMAQYQGLVIAQNTTGMKPGENTVIFKCREDMPTEIIEDGIYSPNLSGLAALHIAIISGANPIYLVGHGMGDSDQGAYHYKNDYTGEIKDGRIWKKFYRVRTYFDNFSEWRHKIFSISDHNEYTAIKNIPLDDFEEKTSIIVKGRLPRIAHLSFSPDLAKHAETTRYMVSQGYGINKLLPFSKMHEFPADLFITNHFLSTDQQIKNFPWKEKAIDIVHTRGCVPSNKFKKAIAMSAHWKKELISNGITEKKIEVIPACINTKAYQGLPDYTSGIFGRITRWSTGKIPEWWNDMLESVFEKFPESKCLMYIQKIDNKRPSLIHPQMEYNQNVHIFENKFQYLRKMAFYVHANGFFKEISPHAILEAMATGLPIVYLHEDSLSEMVGNAGISCKNKHDLKEAIFDFLIWPENLKDFGERAKARAALYDKEIMLKKYNALIKRCLDE